MSIASVTGWRTVDLYSDDKFEVSEDELGSEIIYAIEEQSNESTEDYDS